MTANPGGTTVVDGVKIWWVERSKDDRAFYRVEKNGDDTLIFRTASGWDAILAAAKLEQRLRKVEILQEAIQEAKGNQS